MGEEAKKKNPAWGIKLVGRLCLIGWICVILYECFYRMPILRQMFLSVGPWVCLLAFLHSVYFLFQYRQGIFLVFMLISFPPTVYFGIVFRNIAINQQLDAAANSPADVPMAAQKESTP